MFPYQNEIFLSPATQTPALYYPWPVFDQMVYFYSLTRPEPQIFQSNQQVDKEQNLYHFAPTVFTPQPPQQNSLKIQPQCQEDQKNGPESYKLTNDHQKKEKKHKQKYGRNICSNIFHHLIKKILYQRTFNDQIKYIIKRDKMRITLKEFFQKVEQKKNSLKEYVPFTKLQQFFQGDSIYSSQHEETGQVEKILRALSKLYLKNYHLLHIFSSNKIKGGAKDVHVRQSRKILSIIDGTTKIN